MSLDRSDSPELEAPVGSVADLVGYLRGGEKPAPRWRVGTEHEKIGLWADGFAPIPYEGPRGIAAVLEGIRVADAWSPLFEGDLLLALEKEGASITLEPGGQMELSGAPLRTIHETCDEFQTHLALVKRVSEPLGILWLGLGVNPLWPVADMPRMPKQRYRIMREYLPTRGKLALHMMHLTATVQANLDFSDEQDMAAKMRTAMGLSPIVSAIFANSSLVEGRVSGLASRRLEIWRHTDPDRCGLLHFVFEPDFGYARYVRWSLDVPMFFILRDGRYLPTPGVTFGEFLREGFEGHRALLRDYHIHLTTLFPEVRLKRVLEVRGADAVPSALTCALPALWKGLLYDAAAREAGFELVADWDARDREAALVGACRRGLSGRVGRRRLLDLARELVEIADEGLRRIGHAGRRDADETAYLDPIRAQLERGKSPGEVVAESWDGEWGRSVERLIEYARY